MTLLIWIAIILGIIVCIRLANVVRLASDLSGEDEEDEMVRDNRMNGFFMLVFMVVGLALMIYMTMRYAPYMLPEAASKHGVKIDYLLNVNFIIIAIVFFATEIALFYFANRYRHKRGTMAQFHHEDNKLEIIWTVIPTIVLAVLIVTGLKEWNSITMDKHNDGMNIEIYGMQFNFLARYAGQDNQLGKSNFKLISDENVMGVDKNDSASWDDIITKSSAEMHIPVNQPIEFTMHSRDVLHSAYFPHFRVQMNCVPGMSTRFYFVPTITTAEMRRKTKNEKFDYVLLCNKICGVAHYTMHMKVVVDTPEEFASWLKTQKPAIEQVQPETKTADQAVPEGNAKKVVALN